eukprot:3394721-Pyramimonas_sp.AAC.1
MVDDDLLTKVDFVARRCRGWQPNAHGHYVPHPQPMGGIQVSTPPHARVALVRHGMLCGSRGIQVSAPHVCVSLVRRGMLRGPHGVQVSAH